MFSIVVSSKMTKGCNYGAKGQTLTMGLRLPVQQFLDVIEDIRVNMVL